MADYISREELIKALETDYNSEWRGVEEYVEGARDEYDDVLTIVCGIKAADVQPIDRWISVNDKLPEQDEKVLVLTKDKDIMTMIYKVIPFRWYKPKFGGFDKDYVTHWKPLRDGDTE